MKRANGTGSVYKLSGNRRKPWVVTFTVGFDPMTNKQYKKPYGYYKTKKEAEAIANELSNSNVDIETAKLTLKEVCDLWFKNYSKQTRSNSALVSNSTSINHLYELHSRRFKDLQPLDYENVINGIKAGYSTKRKIKSTLNMVYDFVIKNNLVPVNKVSQYIDLDKSQPKTNPHTIFTETEILELSKIKNDTTAEDILILIYTGLRISELLEMKIEDIHFEDKYMVGGIKTEAGKNRIIPIHEFLMPIIEKRINENKTYLCETPNNKKKTYSSYRDNYWDKLMDTLHWNHTPHDTRHTTATLLDYYNANRTTIKVILGHKTSDVTERFYIHKMLPDFLEAINLIPFPDELIC